MWNGENGEGKGAIKENNYHESSVSLESFDRGPHFITPDKYGYPFVNVGHKFC